MRLRLEAIEDTADDPRIRSEAAAATAEVDRLTRRIDQVLALAKSDAATIGSVASDASILVADRVAAVDPLASERGIAVESSVEPDLIANTLPGLVGRSVDELLGNALDYARSRVRVSLTTSGDRVVLRVEDDGPGVPDEERKRILERFVRGAAANPGGTGLGLALVSEGAAASGGSVRAERSDMGGLAVVVAWPSGAR